MFLDFYRLREQPFGVTPDPRFLFLGQSHREALASLFYGIETDRGFMALIAQPGLGKTTLTFQLLEAIQQTSRTVFLFQTQCNSRELFQYVLGDLGVDASGMNMVTMHDKLNEILARERLAGRRFVLAIDEAQNLEPDVLETVRLLSNFETSRAKLIQIVLIGQPQLATKLAAPALVQLEQRIAVFARLEPFGPEETANYIAHRLGVAGYEGHHLFTPGALRIIADRSQGIPRNINSLCFSALSLGCALGRNRIDAEILHEVVADLDLESLTKPVLTHRTANAPVAVTENPVISYRAKSNKRFRRCVLGGASVAASIGVAGLLLFNSPDTLGRYWKAKTVVAAPALTSSARTESSPKAASMSNPIPFPETKVSEMPILTPLQPPLSNNDRKTVKVLVQPGQTLRQIIRRNLGTENAVIIDQIQKINPGMTDPDHILIGQEIRLPLPSNPVNSSSADRATDMSAKNKERGLTNE